MKNEIIRKPMVKERVEVNLLKLHITTRSRICRKCLTYLINSREASEKACEICLKLKLHKDIAAFQTLQTWIAHVAMFEKLTYPSVKCNFSRFERVTIHYQTLQTWICLNVSRYHNLNTLSHALHLRYHMFSLIFFWFWAICNSLPSFFLKY